MAPQRRVKKLVSMLIPAKSAESERNVTFEEAVLTFLYWRKMDMVPGAVRFTRIKRVREVVVMAHALTIVDFLRNMRKKRKRAEAMRGAEVQGEDSRESRSESESEYDHEASFKDVNDGDGFLFRSSRLATPVQSVAPGGAPAQSLPPGGARGDGEGILGRQYGKLPPM